MLLVTVFQSFGGGGGVGGGALFFSLKVIWMGGLFISSEEKLAEAMEGWLTYIDAPE